MKFLTDLVLPVSDSDTKITAQVAGSIYFNLVSKTIRIHDGTKWHDLAFTDQIQDEVDVGGLTPDVQSVVLWVDTVSGIGGDEGGPPPISPAISEDEIHIGPTPPLVPSVVMWVDASVSTS
jgi:hypothetical protein